MRERDIYVIYLRLRHELEAPRRWVEKSREIYLCYVIGLTRREGAGRLRLDKKRDADVRYVICVSPIHRNKETKP